MKSQYNLSPSAVKYILQNYSRQKQNLRERILALYSELNDTDSLLDVVGYKPCIIDGLPGSQGTHKDLSNVLGHYNRLTQFRERELAIGIETLMREEEALRRVWMCYLALPLAEYDAVTSVFVAGNTHKLAAIEMDISRRTLGRLLNSGIDKIIEMYESPIPYQQLCHLSYRHYKSRITEKNECGTQENHHKHKREE